MTPRAKKRLWALIALLAGFALAVYLLLTALQSSIVFFQTPSDVVTSSKTIPNVFRLGGMVKEASVKKLPDGLTTEFTVTDMHHDLPVRYKGLLPDLFREKQGVVAQGQMEDGVFIASQVLAKHDENYMPAEVTKRLGYDPYKKQ